MATRPTNPPRLVNRVYEQLSPQSEWKKEGEADLLHVYLPGFVKENIRVTTETKNIIRVSGERLVVGNKWNRFQEDFQIPENCNVRGIRAKFDRGILTITMPWKAEVKTTQTSPAPAPARIRTPTKPQESNAKPSSQANAIPSQAAPSTSPTKKAESRSSQAMNTPKPANSPNLTSITDAQSVREDKTSTTTSSESNEIKRPEMFPNTMEKSVWKENIEGIEKKDKEPNQDEKVIKKIVEKRDEEKSGFGGYSLEEYKQVVKGLARGLSEERELMVNMAAAVLVIVALGAYVSYTSFGK